MDSINGLILNEKEYLFEDHRTPVDNLLSESSELTLSANQGRVLNEKISKITPIQLGSHTIESGSTSFTIEDDIFTSAFFASNSRVTILYKRSDLETVANAIPHYPDENPEDFVEGSYTITFENALDSDVSIVSISIEVEGE